MVWKKCLILKMPVIMGSSGVFSFIITPEPSVPRTIIMISWKYLSRSLRTHVIHQCRSIIFLTSCNVCPERNSPVQVRYIAHNGKSHSFNLWRIINKQVLVDSTYLHVLYNTLYVNNCVIRVNAWKYYTDLSWFPERLFMAIIPY